MDVANLELKLKEFLYDADSLNELQEYKVDVNFFKILKMQRQEIKHSNFLGWLLDPNANHQLGTAVLEKILISFLRENDDYKPIDIFDLLKCDLTDLVVFREMNNIDLLLVSKKSNLVVTIENKIDTGEHDNQLEKYKKYVNEEYSNYKQIFIYLTIDKSESSDPECWRPYSYIDLCDDITNVIENNEINEKARLYIKDYLEIIRSEFMDNDELREKCQNIYFKHKEAIDLIINYIPDEYYERYKKLREALKKYEDKIEIITDSTTYIRFVSKKIKSIVPKTENDYWVSSGDFIVYEIKNKKNDNCVLQLLIGPAEDDIRKKCYDLIKGEFKKTKGYNVKFNQIDAVTLAKKVDENGDFPETVEDAVNALCKYMESSFDKNDIFFESKETEIKSWE